MLLFKPVYIESLYFLSQRYSVGSVNSNAVLKLMGRGSARGAARGVRGGVGGRGNVFHYYVI